MSDLIFVQPPAPDPIKILKARLIKEEQFEKANKLPSFRVALIKEIIEELKTMR